MLCAFPFAVSHTDSTHFQKYSGWCLSLPCPSVRLFHTFVIWLKSRYIVSYIYHYSFIPNNFTTTINVSSAIHLFPSATDVSLSLQFYSFQMDLIRFLQNVYFFTWTSLTKQYAIKIHPCLFCGLMIPVLLFLAD